MYSIKRLSIYTLEFPANFSVCVNKLMVNGQCKQLIVGVYNAQVCRWCYQKWSTVSVCDV